MITFPNAKINLGLNVVERRSDGYHNLETIFYPIHLEDALEVVEAKNEKASGCILHLTGVPIAGNTEENLVVKAYNMLAQEFSLPFVHIYMHKHIPLGAGLGGGSSDAAYMLKLLRDKFLLPLDDQELENRAAILGADCAFFIKNQPVFATGIGNIFSPIDLSLSGYSILLIKPDVFVSTRDAFALISPHKPQRSLKDIITHPVEQWKELGMCNDFEHSVFAKHPAIGRIKEQIYSMGAAYASMSGSGSSVFGLFRHAPSKEEIAREFPECFCRINNL